MIVLDRSNSPEDLKHQEQEKNRLQSTKGDKSRILKEQPSQIDSNEKTSKEPNTNTFR